VTPIAPNDHVLLMDDRGRKYLIRAVDRVGKVKGIGVFNPYTLVDQHYGTTIKIGTKHFVVLHPSVVDKVEGIPRRAQIITPKDAAQIALQCDVNSGDLIVEGGMGSGALTIVLASLVKPDGRVISYEWRKDFARFAQQNLALASLEQWCEIKLGDITQGIDEVGVDAVILDLPNPWDVVETSFNALRVCGHFASYSPTIGQVEKTVAELRRRPFAEIKVLETLQREIVVGPRGTRPSSNMLGHTGYLTFARKIL